MPQPQALTDDDLQSLIKSGEINQFLDDLTDEELARVARLGTRMVKSLCELYEVPVREIELQKTLTLTTEQARTALPLLLAVAGNAAKAFPGIGTLAGGLMHAVAYGLIFDALGRAVARTLETRGALRPAPTSLLFKDNLASDVESQARKLLRLALDVKSEQQQK